LEAPPERKKTHQQSLFLQNSQNLLLLLMHHIHRRPFNPGVCENIASARSVRRKLAIATCWNFELGVFVVRRIYVPCLLSLGAILMDFCCRGSWEIGFVVNLALEKVELPAGRESFVVSLGLPNFCTVQAEILWIKVLPAWRWIAD
jgi:hypothetical protein